MSLTLRSVSWCYSPAILRIPPTRPDASPQFPAPCHGVGGHLQAWPCPWACQDASGQALGAARPTLLYRSPRLPATCLARGRSLRICKYLPRASAHDAPGQARHALPPRLLHASPQSASTWFGFSAYTSPQLPPTCLACLGTCKVVHTAKCGLMFLAKLSAPSYFPMHLLGFLPLSAHGHRFHLSRWHPVAREKNSQTGAFTLATVQHDS